MKFEVNTDKVKNNSLKRNNQPRYLNKITRPISNLIKLKINNQKIQLKYRPILNHRNLTRLNKRLLFQQEEV